MPTKAPPAHAKLTPPEVAKRFRCSPEKVIAWILAGELHAINVAARLGGRPRWLIDQKDLADFERRRSAAPLPRRQRTKAAAKGFVRYY
jgi:hypothetical protein